MRRLLPPAFSACLPAKRPPTENRYSTVRPQTPPRRAFSAPHNRKTKKEDTTFVVSSFSCMVTINAAGISLKPDGEPAKYLRLINVLPLPITWLRFCCFDQHNKYSLYMPLYCPFLVLWALMRSVLDVNLAFLKILILSEKSVITDCRTASALSVSIVSSLFALSILRV